MSNQSIVIDLPEDIYNKYKQRAEQTQRSVEAGITDSLLKTAPQNAEPSDKADNLIAQLAFFDDIALQRLVTNLFPKKEAARIEQLRDKQEAGGLDEVETGEMAELVKKAAQWFHFLMVLRIEALQTQLERGQNNS